VINSLNDSRKRKIGTDKCWTEAIRCVNGFDNKKRNQTPVRGNLYPTFAKCKDTNSGVPKPQQNRDHTNQNKDEGNKLKNKILIMGDSHTRGLAMNLRHNLDDDHRVHGLVKPGSN
jgi:hypothetical protein